MVMRGPGLSPAKAPDSDRLTRSGRGRPARGRLRQGARPRPDPAARGGAHTTPRAGAGLTGGRCRPLRLRPRGRGQRTGGQAVLGQPGGTEDGGEGRQVDEVVGAGPQEAAGESPGQARPGAARGNRPGGFGPHGRTIPTRVGSAAGFPTVTNRLKVPVHDPRATPGTSPLWGFTSILGWFGVIAASVPLRRPPQLLSLAASPLGLPSRGLWVPPPVPGYNVAHGVRDRSPRVPGSHKGNGEPEGNGSTWGSAIRRPTSEMLPLPPIR
jgi:hypothetical protein